MNKTSLITLCVAYMTSAGLCNNASATEFSGTFLDGSTDRAFRSGFDLSGTLKIQITSDGNDIIGRDVSFKKTNSSGGSEPETNNWENIDPRVDSSGTTHWWDADLQYQANPALEQEAKIISDPRGSSNKVLSFSINRIATNSAKGRVQLELVNSKADFKHFHYRFRMYLPLAFSRLQSFVPQIDPETLKSTDFLILSELYNHRGVAIPDDSSYFTIKLRVTLDGNLPRFQVTGEMENADSDFGWAIDPQAPIPLGQWIQCQLTFLEGDETTGRVGFKAWTDGSSEPFAEGSVLGLTQSENDAVPNGIRTFAPLKLYASSRVIDHIKNPVTLKPMTVHFDDLEINHGEPANARFQGLYFLVNEHVEDTDDPKIILKSNATSLASLGERSASYQDSERWMLAQVGAGHYEIYQIKTQCGEIVRGQTLVAEESTARVLATSTSIQNENLAHWRAYDMGGGMIRFRNIGNTKSLENFRTDNSTFDVGTAHYKAPDHSQVLRQRWRVQMN